MRSRLMSAATAVVLWGMVSLSAAAQPATRPALRDIGAVHGRWLATYATADGGTEEAYMVVQPQDGVRKKVQGVVYKPEGPSTWYNLEYAYDGRYMTSGSYSGFKGLQMELSADGNELRGEHGPKDKRRQVIWRRLRMQVDQVTVTGALDWPEVQDGLRHAMMMGNLPAIHVEITGKDLPTRLVTWVEIRNVWLSDPHLTYRSVSRSDDGGKLTVHIWLRKGVLPGRKVLHIEGEEIEFDLKFERYEQPKPEKVRSVLLRSSGDREPDAPRDQARVGDWLTAVVTYEQPPGDDRRTVHLRLRRQDGSVESHAVEVRRVGTAEYQSQPIRLVGSPRSAADEPVTP